MVTACCPVSGVLRGNHHPMHQKYSQLGGSERGLLPALSPRSHLSGAGILPDLLLAQVSFQHSDAGLSLLHLL